MTELERRLVGLLECVLADNAPQTAGVLLSMLKHALRDCGTASYETTWRGQRVKCVYYGGYDALSIGIALAGQFVDYEAFIRNFRKDLLGIIALPSVKACVPFNMADDGPDVTPLPFVPERLWKEYLLDSKYADGPRCVVSLEW